MIEFSSGEKVLVLDSTTDSLMKEAIIIERSALHDYLVRTCDNKVLTLPINKIRKSYDT